MKYRLLGKTGLRVSRLTLGTMTFGASNWGCDEKTSMRIISRYLDAGGNCIDVADVYAGGLSEIIVGKFLKNAQRDKIILASKAGFPVSQDPNHQGLSRAHLIDACNKSLKRLGTDYLDLFYLHLPDPTVPPEEMFHALDFLYKQGKIRYAGVSNFPVWEYTRLCVMAEKNGYISISAGQYLYNLIHRGPEEELFPAAKAFGTGLFAYSPLAGGMLTGKYKGMEKPVEGTRFSYREKTDGVRFWHERGKKIADRVLEISEKSGIPPYKLAIGWNLSRSEISSVIIGARTIEQFEKDIEIEDSDLPEDVIDMLDKATSPIFSYESWLAREQARAAKKQVEFFDAR
ncbi:aldo/keto reductase [Spirochaetia bacterium 38H-sp]|uniref:Aldo/keto reductase n=1 Tax=Rarispira pelagica TaxID=3141764 RepID=A0ABU9U9G7_9SPIR